MSKQQNNTTDETFRPESQADRWIKYGSNVALSVILVVLLGAGIIYFAQKANRRIDMTTGGSLSLKPQTVNVVKDLKQHITLVSLYTRPESNEEKDQAQRAQAQRVQDLLDEYKSENGKIDIKTIDPAKEKDKLEELHQDFVNRYGKQIKNYKEYLDEWRKNFDQIKKMADDEAKAIAKFAPKTSGPEEEESPIAGFVSQISDEVPEQLARTRKAVDHELKKKHPDFKAAANAAKEQMDSASQLAGALIAQAPRIAAAPNLPGEFRKYVSESVPRYQEMKKIADESVARQSKLGELKVDQLEQALNVENPILVLGDEDWRILGQKQIWQDDNDVRAMAAGGKIAERFAGEQQVTTAIYSLENPHKQKICFIRASGPPWTPQGFPPFIPGGPMSMFAERLREYNFEVLEKDLSGMWAMQAQAQRQPAAPEPSDEEIKDAIWVVLDLPQEQNPQMPTPPAALGRKLKEHLAHGGSALVLGYPRAENLSEALNDWGVTMMTDTVVAHEVVKLTEAAQMDPLEEAKAQPYIWDIRSYGDHPLVKPIQNLDSAFVMPLAIKTVQTKGYTATPFLPFADNMPGLKTWATTSIEDVGKGTAEFHQDKGDILPPLYGGAIVEKQGGGRLVVVGAVQSYMNQLLRILDPRLFRRDPPIRVNRFPGNMELATNSIFWLAHLEPMIAISPAAMDVSRIGDMSSGVLNFWRIGVLLILLPGAVLAAGAAVYIARRD